MPSLGADMDAGKLTRWNIKPGDRVKRGDIVAEVETEKSDIDVEIFTSGCYRETRSGHSEARPAAVAGTDQGHLLS